MSLKDPNGLQAGWNSHSHTVIRHPFLFITLGSTATVVAARLLHAVDPGYDLTLQIQTAHNLLAGNGFTIYSPTAADLSEPFTRLVMTHFAAGYSLYAAAMIAAGIDPATFITIPGVIVTFAGWWGWARLAVTVMGDGGAAHPVWRACAYWIAFVCPLLFTHPWGGTDYLLWAAVPWTLERLTSAGTSQGTRQLRSDAFIGLIVGATLLARYQSAFLALAVAVVIVGQSAGQPVVALRRLAAFAVGLAPALVTQGYVNFWIAAGARPGGVTVSAERIANLGSRALDTLPSLAGANQAVLFWLPLRFQFWQDPAHGHVGLLLAAAVLLVPVLLVLASRRWRIAGGFRDLRVIATALLIALPLFLWVCSLFSTAFFARYLRYYGTLRPLAICLAFYLATMSCAGRSARIAQLMARAYLAAFVLMSAAEVGLMVVSERGASWRQAFLGVLHLREWPSSGLVYDTSPARSAALEAMRADPRARLITTREHWFYADPGVDRSRIMRWDRCEALSATHATGPTRFLVLVLDAEPFRALTSPVREVPPQECLARLPGFTMLRRFPEEGLLFMETRIPAGTRVTLKPEVESSRAGT